MFFCYIRRVQTKPLNGIPSPITLFRDSQLTSGVPLVRKFFDHLIYTSLFTIMADKKTQNRKSTRTGERKQNGIT